MAGVDDHIPGPGSQASPLGPLVYTMTAWRLRNPKPCPGINITISNLSGADHTAILSGVADRKIALCSRRELIISPLIGQPTNTWDHFFPREGL